MAVLKPIAIDRDTGGFKEINNPDTISADAIAEMLPATSEAGGYHGLVPTPSAGDEDKILAGNKTWVDRYVHPVAHPPSIITQDSSNRFITDAERVSWTAKIDDTEKGVASGVATLDADGKIPNEQLGPLAITSSYVAADETEQLALTVEEGDVCVRSDENKSYVALNSTNGSMSDWRLLLTPTDAVLSVNGKTGTPIVGNIKAPVSTPLEDNIALFGVDDGDGNLLLKDGGATTPFGLTLLGAADAPTAQTSLGLGDSATKNVGSGGSDVASGSHNHDASYAATSHVHGASAIASGTLAVARLPVMTGDSGSGGEAGVVPSQLIGDKDSFLTGGATWLRNNFSAVTGPVSTDDSASGYGIGSLWIDTASKMVYTCADASVSNAVWVTWSSEEGSTNPVTSTNFVGDGVTTDFVLPEVPVSKHSLLISLNGIRQHTDAYSFSGTTLTFSGPPADQTGIEVVYLRAGGSGTVQTSAIGTSGSISIDLAEENVFTTNLTGDVTSLIITNPLPSGYRHEFTLRITQDTVVREIAWPGSIVWGGVGTEPTIAENATVVCRFYTDNGGTTWFVTY